MRIGTTAAAFAALGMMAACVPRPAPPAPPPPPPVLPPTQPEPPPPPAADWQEAPLSPGDWDFPVGPGEARAEFRSDGLALSLACRGGRAMTIGVDGAQGPSLVIRTTYGERRLPAAALVSGQAVAELSPSDPLLDQIAFSRGRILVQVEGGPALILPSWPEPARAIEECRGRG
jgi:hypothetical protein